MIWPQHGQHSDRKLDEGVAEQVSPNLKLDGEQTPRDLDVLHVLIHGVIGEALGKRCFCCLHGKLNNKAICRFSPSNPVSAPLPRPEKITHLHLLSYHKTFSEISTNLAAL